MSRTVVIVEPEAPGHRLQHVRWICADLAKRGARVVLLTTEPTTQHPAFTQLLEATGKSLDVHLMPAPSTGGRDNAAGLVKSHLRYWKAFQDGFRSLPKPVSPDIAFVPYLDYCDRACAILGSPFGRTPWAGTVMGVMFQYPEAGVEAPVRRSHSLQRSLFKRLLTGRTLRALFTIDEPLREVVAKSGWANRDRLHYVADPQGLGKTLTRAKARESLSLREDQVAILSYGALSRRKGVHRLLQALGEGELPEAAVVVLAGRPDQGVSDLLETPAMKKCVAAGSLKLLLHFLDASEEERVLRAADLVWMRYEGHYYSSGVLPLAAAAGVPVLACSAGVIGWETKRYDLGLVAPTGAALKPLIEEAVTEDRGKSLAKFADSRTTERYAAGIGSILCD